MRLSRLSFHSIRATLAECEWRASAVLSAPTSRTGVFIFRSTMSNSDAPSRHRRKPGNDDAELHCRDALRIRVCFKKACLERTGGHVFASQGVFAPQRGRRSAERRTNSCRASMRRRGRGPISGPLAFRRSSAVMRRDHSQLGLGRASWNHRMQTGGPSPAPVQRAPRSPARAGRADTQTARRLRATNSARRNRTRSVSRRHRLTSLTMNGMDAVIQIRARAVKGFSIYADKSRGYAERLPLRASPDAFHSTPKIRKRQVVPVNQSFPCRANLFAAARRRPNCTARRFPLVPARGHPVRIPACAGMSRIGSRST